ncbi:uncharacterized protein TRIVIDRAFT_217495 [Trichoderma virens Gv29-8]|uniref:Myb-like domain-containing protein n=1 Tax=Hypocrea virens (strain Gv29-8 / FGSC 10586) TaxID=413071 RepID=G9MER9_HYPVG|nr:uncharacterized protein TRIVIDRAFT_217495 [Trichoderma virens Gv29-8]EHK26887.1 hypothetical protein TRIVIDRAFT_217495 [Trichoderma virens Gv29-8]UKZ57341.1 hypothetical protein TrVGV298_011194 [Trichoderma virens]
MDDPVPGKEKLPFEGVFKVPTSQNGASNPSVESNNSEPQEESNNLPELTWRERALAAGRTPLPSSRPPIKSQTTSSDDSGKTACGSSDNNLETKDHHAVEDKEKWTIEDEVASPKAQDGEINVKKPDPQQKEENAHALVKSKGLPRAPRKKWMTDEISRVISMRMDGASWDSISAEFPDRTLASIRQIFFKYRYRNLDIDSVDEEE